MTCAELVGTILSTLAAVTVKPALSPQKCRTWVLAADSSRTKVDLCHQCAERGRGWLAPTVWILAKLLKYSLEGKLEV